MVPASRFSLWPTMAALFISGLINASATRFSPEIAEELNSERDQVLDLWPNDLPPYLGLNSAVRQSENSSLVFASTDSLRRVDLWRNQEITMVGAPGETVRLDLGHFLLQGHSTFTLQGTATTSFVIVVRNRFELTRASKVFLTGGLQWDDVVFHIRGKGDTVYLNKQASLEGTIMANHRTVRLGGHATICGQVIAKNVLLQMASQIVQPPIVSP